MSDMLFGGNSAKKKSNKKLEKPSKRSGDLLFTASGKVSNKKETHQTQTYTFTFEANSSKYNAQTIEANGTIQQIYSPVNYTLSKLTSSSPFKEKLQTGDSVSKGDIVDVELDSQPNSQVKVEVIVSYTDGSYTKTLPEDLGGNGQYCYFVNVPDGTISNFDVVNETVTTIDVAANTDYTAGDFNCCIYYRYTTKELYFHYINNSSGRVAIIDADPLSNSFNNIVQNQDFGSNRSSRSFFYDQNRDQVLHFRRHAQLLDFSGNKLKEIYNSKNEEGSNHSYFLGRFLLQGDVSGATRAIQIRDLDQSIITGEVRSKGDGHGKYNPVNGLVYYSDDAIRVYETKSFSLVASISLNHNQGNLAVDFINNLIFYVHGGSNTVGILDGSSNTNLNTVRTNTNGYSKPLFSPITEKFYVAEANSNQLLIVNPNLNRLIEKQITIGNQGANNPRLNLADINQIKL